MPINVPSLTPTKNTVLVTNIESGDRLTRGGIIVLDDDGKERGIRERWAQVWSKHPDVEDIEVGQWILIKHGRWSRGVQITDAAGQALTIRKIDWPDAVLLCCDTNPLDV
jgi:hypothetical protein